jgi:uncharacterized protein (DUF2336 family)
MSLAFSHDHLLNLARQDQPGNRERLLDGLIALGREQPNAMEPRSREILESIFLKLISDAERDIRIRVANQIADENWPPSGLITLLIMDDIDIARPLIAASPLVKDSDLIRLLSEATLDHQIEVARRPRLSPVVVDAVILTGEPVVLTALAKNTETHLSVSALTALVEAARVTPPLQGSLARHPQLSEELATQLYAWVGQSLRKSLGMRFKLDTDKLDVALSTAIGESLSGKPTENLETPAPQGNTDERLIEKLAAAGQLRSGLLFRSIQEGKLSLFVAALARLGSFVPRDINLALQANSPESLALACASVGIDRSVFPDLIQGIRALNDGLPGGDATAMRKAMGAFGPFDRDISATAFRASVGRV